MIKYLALSCISIYIFTSCALQGSISGGPQDKKPPVYSPTESNPPANTIHFKEKEIKLKFDEFFKLNNPSQTISVIPNSIKINALAHDKTLHLSIIGELDSSTTYAIYMNKTIQDIHEGNDSLLSYVFSTGSFIDSLAYRGKVIDAFTRKPIEKSIVGLIPKDSAFTTKVHYFTSTSKQGEYNLNYLKKGEYKLVAFNDKNNNLKIDPQEEVAFKTLPISLDQKTNDSIALNFFTPTPKKQYKSVTFKGPAQINIIGNQSLTDSEISINGITIPPSQRYFFRNDSLQIISSSILSDTSIVIIKNNKYADTIILKTKLKERIKAPSLSYLPYVTGNPLELFFSDSILSIQLDSIIVLIDSIPIEYKMLKKETNRLTLSFIPKKDLKKITLKINPNGILFSNFKGDYSSITKINPPDKNDLGSIKLKLDSIKTGTILQLLKNNQEIAKTIKKSNEWLINDLVKGEYSLRLIMDENNNGIWDTGSISELRQPEEVRYLNKPLLARANWEIEVTLSPTHFNFK